MREALKAHWPEYLMEAALLGSFLVSACLFSALIQHPASPIRHAVIHPVMRRALMGVAMGLTAMVLINSPWGKRSGAHLNPAVTLTYYRLGKVTPWDALFYAAFQFGGAIGGVLLAKEVLRMAIAHPAVNYAATIPGFLRWPGAFAGEFVIAFGLMTAVLHSTNSARAARFTPLFAGLLVASYIVVEAPLSGMSMNPARTFGSAFSANVWTALWVYFFAPPLAMLAAADAYVRMKGRQRVICAKLHHQNNKRCIFRCGFAAAGVRNGDVRAVERTQRIAA